MTELAVSNTAFSATEKSLAEAEKLIESSLTDAEKLIMGMDEDIEKPLSNGFSKDLDDSITEDDNFSMKLMLSDDESDPKTPKPLENPEVILNGKHLTEPENKQEEALTNGTIKETNSDETIMEKDEINKQANEETGSDQINKDTNLEEESDQTNMDTNVEKESDQINKDTNVEKESDQVNKDTSIEKESDQINKDTNAEKESDQINEDANVDKDIEQNEETNVDEVNEKALLEINNEIKLEEDESDLGIAEIIKTEENLVGEIKVEETVIVKGELKEEVKEGNMEEGSVQEAEGEVSKDVEKVDEQELAAVSEKAVVEDVLSQIDETINVGIDKVVEESSIRMEDDVKETTGTVVDDVLKSIDDVLNDEIPLDNKVTENEAMDTDLGIDKVDGSKASDESVEPIEKLLQDVGDNLEKVQETGMEVDENNTSNTEPVDMEVENELVTDISEKTTVEEEKTPNDPATESGGEKSEQDTAAKEPIESLDSLIEVNQELTNAKIREMEEEDIQDLDVDEENKPEDEESELDDQTAATSTDITEDEDFSQDATPQILNVGTLEDNSNDDNDPDDPDYEDEEEEDDENIPVEDENIGLDENPEIEDESVGENMDIEKEDTDIEKDDTDIEKDETDLEKDETDLEKNDTDLEKNDTALEKNDAEVEKETVVEKDGTEVLEKDKRKLDLDQEDECSESKRRKTDHKEDMEVETEPKEAIGEKVPEVEKNKLDSKNDEEKKSEETVKKIEKKREVKILTILPKIFKNEKIPEIDIEEFILTKLIEAISQRTELAILRVKAQKQETIIDQLRKKTAHLSKQLEDISTVTNRLQIDLQQKDRPVAPVKITRSVGLQVAMPSGPAKRLTTVTTPTATTPVTKKFKQKPPTTNVVSKTPPVINKTPAKIPPKPVTPVKSTPVQQINKTPPTVLNKQLPRLNPPVQKPVQKIVQKVPVNKSPINKTVTNANKPVIDLTDEEDPKKQAPGLIPLNAGNIRMVSVSNPGANSNSQNVTYLMAAPGQNRQLLIATSNANIGAKPTFVVSQNARGQTQTPTRYMIQNGQALVQRQNVVLANGVRGVPVRMNARPIRPPANSHPASLPIMLNQPHHPSWKQIPPRPSLRISRGKDDGIQLSWLMPELDPKIHEEVVSYQLYAYQEGSAPPSSDLWRKVGDVKALPLPMACTLTSFHPGNKYYFAVRAIDNHSRVSQFSYAQPISLVH